MDGSIHAGPIGDWSNFTFFLQLNFDSDIGLLFSFILHPPPLSSSSSLQFNSSLSLPDSPVKVLCSGSRGVCQSIFIFHSLTHFFSSLNSPVNSSATLSLSLSLSLSGPNGA